MADQTVALPPDHKAIAERLLAAANDGAKSLKALFFWYVGALAYAVISVAGVTDEQLLKASPLKLRCSTGSTLPTERSWTPRT